MSWKRWALFGLAVVVALLVGVGIGAASAGSTSALHSAQHAETSLRASNTTLGSEVSTLQGKLQAAQSKAADAQASAQAKYAGEAARLRKQAKQLARQQGNIKSNTISSDGVYVVGRDIQPGLYHTTGGNQCYYATLNSTNTSNIADNNIVSGPATVSLNGVYAFDISGGCTWVKIG